MILNKQIHRSARRRAANQPNPEGQGPSQDNCRAIELQISCGEKGEQKEQDRRDDRSAPKPLRTVH